MKTFKLFICTYDGQINARVFEVQTLDEELAITMGRLMINTMWPECSSSTLLAIESRISLDMLEPSMN